MKPNRAVNTHHFQPIKTAELIWREGLPCSTLFDDVYFSKDGGVSEAQHVFIEGNGLIERWQQLSKDNVTQFVIGETGFGSGLNFLVTYWLWKNYAPESAKLHYFSCEKHPLTRDDLKRCLALWPMLSDLAAELLENYPTLVPGFHQLSFCNDRVHLTLMLGDAIDCYHELLVSNDVNVENNLRGYCVDAWFLDGFSPKKNPEMWHEELFKTLAMLSGINTTFATYSVANMVKNGLEASGFQITKKPGYGSKRDMLTGIFLAFPAIRTRRFTPWHIAERRPPKEKTAIVIGAGLAGCFVANALAKRGWVVTVIDEQPKIANGASANQQAILYPKLTAFRSPLTAFMLSAYLYACRIYKQILNHSPIGDLSGILQLAYGVREQDNQNHLKDWLANYPELGQLVTAEQASAIAGIELSTPGLYIPHSGWINSSKLCQFLLTHPKINLVLNEPANTLQYIDNTWHVNEQSAEILVIANGHQACSFEQTSHIPLKTIRGQMSYISSHEQSEQLKIPLCADGHILPAKNGMHFLGATYDLMTKENCCLIEDDQMNLAKLSAFATNFAWSNEVVGQWAGIRAAAPDYLPLVGPVANVENFNEQLKGLASNPRRWLNVNKLYHEGLYLCTGFGSRGLTMIPMCAEWLAKVIHNEPSPLPRSMIQTLSPARFLRKEIIRPTTQKKLRLLK